MDFGANTSLVQEVLDFAKSGLLLRDANASTYSNCKIVVDFAEAKRYAWSQEPNAGEAPWVNLRENQVRIFSKEKYVSPNWKELNVALGELLGKLATAVSGTLPKQYGEIVDDVVGDLHNCASQRAISGRSTGLIEQIFEGYKGGAWPCGWNGIYPNGQLIVYMP